MLKRILLITGLLCVGLTAYAARAPDSGTAVKAASAWLRLVDARQYAASWQQAAPLFQRAVSEQQWAEKLRAAREPFGKLLKRSLSDARYFTRLPGAPAGRYWVIEENADFANKPGAVETITMEQVGGHWRAAGYFIR